VTARIVDGRALAREIEARVDAEVAELSRHRPLRLVAVSVGGGAASEVYLRNQRRACERARIEYVLERLPERTQQSALHARLAALSHDVAVTGVILQLPLPPSLSARAAQDAIDPAKDVEGVHRDNLGMVAGGRALLAPCTARAAVHILEAEGVALKGAECVVVGHSEIVGKPVAMLLLDRLATVTVCHIETRDLASHTRRADVVVVAVGKAGLIRGEMLRRGAAVVDVGINVTADGKVVGDVAADAGAVAGLLTPVPGGVGPVTVAMLLQNTVTAAKLQRGSPPSPSG
jgi:methylenetetrahydrofolate dehydrogenase (NADP+) / methenyltetrahydrofolate cyclohydrolase